MPDVIDAYSHVTNGQTLDALEAVHPSEELDSLRAAPRMTAVDGRVEHLDRHGVDRQVISQVPSATWGGGGPSRRTPRTDPGGQRRAPPHRRRPPRPLPPHRPRPRSRRRVRRRGPPVRRGPRVPRRAGVLERGGPAARRRGLRAVLGGGGRPRRTPRGLPRTRLRRHGRQQRRRVLPAPLRPRFLGVDNVLFGYDYPFGPDRGEYWSGSIRAAVDDLGRPPAETERMLAGNARRLLDL